MIDMINSIYNRYEIRWKILKCFQPKYFLQNKDKIVLWIKTNKSTDLILGWMEESEEEDLSREVDGFLCSCFNIHLGRSLDVDSLDDLQGTFTDIFPELLFEVVEDIIGLFGENLDPGSPTLDANSLYKLLYL